MPQPSRPLTLRTAKLIFGGFNATVVDCLVRDLTPPGRGLKPAR